MVTTFRTERNRPAASEPTTSLTLRPEITVVVPTRNEETNVDPLVERIRRVLEHAGFRYEILFVDDSDDGTPGAIANHAREGSPVRLLHRRPGTRAGGLGGALCAGFADAHGRFAVCIDGDLQHPPELLAPMARVLIDRTADLVIGSRYAIGGRGSGLDGPWRQFVSVASRDLARLVVPAVRQTTDPGSGLFGFDRRILEAVTLRPHGHKTLIEILARGNWSTIAEIPYTFETRLDGASNASAREGGRFVRHLARLASDPEVRARRAGSRAGRAFAVPHSAVGSGDGPQSVVVRYDAA